MFIFSKDKLIVETDYRDKSYFSDRQNDLTLQDKCFVCVLGVLGILFTMNIFAYSFLA